MSEIQKGAGKAPPPEPWLLERQGCSDRSLEEERSSGALKDATVEKRYVLLTLNYLFFLLIDS